MITTNPHHHYRHISPFYTLSIYTALNQFGLQLSDVTSNTNNILTPLCFKIATKIHEYHDTLGPSNWQVLSHPKLSDNHQKPMWGGGKAKDTPPNNHPNSPQDNR